ncbi:prolyl-tRNA synthetase ProS [Thermacetogenium phaeum DSM 12270]|uniref:Proline--tRNA ligase n=1 Tax=Thermacetogenium phaeum (strain ATCC BAA-254 / DSM 26808 / PB) TaxID=1089553 RepID=K4LEU7_THEPS|nr:proline--tRNA ligase [Thermacetogenium phaeum]AFV11348.1 prolyl-tRNA synthetase ProS [Thermacetogenium phaeum DSM 12270]
MRVTRMLIPTLREVPAEADAISHQLLLRAGMVRRVAAGVYSLLPLGNRVVKKIEKIVREEMERAGGTELLLPIIQPAEVWHESGRWNVYGPELFRLQDRHGRDFCLGPTHEELITTLFRQEIKSYRQLPLLLYQIQNKYRDERRPRFGLLRGREFIMKDLYSFDRDEEGLDISYRKMYEAYTRVFSRCGLVFRVVEADTGAIGGTNSHEFMVLADTGEEELVFCSLCDYAANTEKAPCRPQGEQEEEARPLQLVATPAARTVDDLASYLGVDARKILKSLFFDADGEPVVVLVRGDRSVNETKVKNFLLANSLEIADEVEILNRYGVPMGFAGPVGLREKMPVKILGDEEVRALSNAVAGANRVDYHYLNVNPGRDFDVDVYGDFRTAQEGDPCPLCGAPLQVCRGIEVGHIFKLGTKYSEALKATIIDEKGNEVPVVMGCYGIGITRTMAAAVEQKHDQDGIIWPVAIAPYEVVLMAVNQGDALHARYAEELYREFLQAGIDVIYDDRLERPGVKFKDADLIGYPARVVIGKKMVSEGLLEIKWRETGETVLKKRSEAVEYLRQKLSAMRSREGE